MWSELTDEYVVENKVWPRAAAAAEILWSGKRDIGNNTRTSKDAAPRLSMWRKLGLARGVKMSVVQMPWCEMNQGQCASP